MNYQFRVPSSEFRVSPHAEPETRNPERGFSLVEVVIAMAILAIGLFGAVRVFPVGLQASRRSEWSSRATMVAQRTLEAMKLASCADLNEAEAADNGMTLTTRKLPLAVPHLVDATRLQGIELTVGWQQDGRPRSQVFVTYLRCVPQ